MNDNIGNSSNNVYKLYNQVFGNIVLSKRIFNDVMLYKKNEIVTINTRSELLEYKEREYIQLLKYNGVELNVGDIPNNSVLKKIIFGKDMLIVEENIIPFGVEIIEYSKHQILNTPFSALPYSIHTIKNSVIILPVQSLPAIHPSPKTQSIHKKIQYQFNHLSLAYLYKAINQELFFECLVNLFGETNAINYKNKVDSMPMDVISKAQLPKDFNLQDVLYKTDQCRILFKLHKEESKLPYEYYTIPPNITSLSFLNRLDYLKDNNNGGEDNEKEYKFIIPNTIKELKFEEQSYDIIGNGKPICKGDIPEGVTSLSTYSNFTWWDLNSNERILPNSIKILKISGLLAYSKYFSFIIGTNIESLEFDGFDMGLCISKDSDLYQCNSIKKLTISKVSKIQSNSLPSSITELKLSNICKFCIFELNSIPNSVTRLDLSNNNGVDFDLTLIKVHTTVTNLILPTPIKIKK